MNTNITIFAQYTRIFKILFYIYDYNYLNNKDMNNKCTINPQLIIKYDFKHIFTYKLLYHIMAYYDNDSKTLMLDKQDIELRYNSNHHSVNNAIRELIDYKVIVPNKSYKNKYTINNKVFINFINGLTK